MNNNESSPNSEFVDEKRQLLYWIADWSRDGNSFEIINLDLPELSVLFQAMGFKLETFGKTTEGENVSLTSNSSNVNSNLRIELTCSKSGMQSTLTRQTADCKCPSEEETEGGQFWSVTGCGPSSQSSIHSSNSSLIPTISSGKLQIVSCLMAKIFTIINESNVGQKDKSIHLENATIMTRHRSLDTLRSVTNQMSLSGRGLKRGFSWELDPQTSPPKSTSSPVARLSNSFNQISLDSEKTNVVMKNLETMQKLLSETLEIATGSNSTFVTTGRVTRKVSDIKPAEGPSVSDLIGLEGCFSGRYSLPRLNSLSSESQTPRKKVMLRKPLGSTEERRGLLKPSRISALTKRTLVGSTPALSPKSPRGCIPKLGSNLVKSKYAVKSKIDTGLGIYKSKLSPNIPKEDQPGTSGIARLKNLGKASASSLTKKK